MPGTWVQVGTFHKPVPWEADTLVLLPWPSAPRKVGGATHVRLVVRSLDESIKRSHGTGFPAGVLPSSTMRQNALSSDICSTERQDMRARAGEATTMARDWALEMATFRR